MPQPPPMPQRQRRRRGNPTPGTQGALGVRSYGRGLANGDIVISRSELLATTTSTPTATSLHPSSFPWLKTLAKVFERYRFVSVALEYRPLVGTNTAGSSSMGVDWMTNSIKLMLRDDGLHPHLGTADKSTILALTPSVDGPSWQRVPRLNVPSNIINSRLWYNAKAPAKDEDVESHVPGYVAYMSTSDNAGEIWVHYKIHFSGTHQSA